MKKCAFTIVAKNYIGLAKLLGKSIKNTTQDVDFYIFIADEIGTNSILNEDNIFEARKTLHQYTESEWINMSFKSSVSLLIFCLDYISIDVSGILKFSTLLVLL